MLFYSYKEDLVTNYGIILKGQRIVIPDIMKNEMLKKIHTGHLGIHSCLSERILFCPGMSTDI